MIQFNDFTEKANIALNQAVKSAENLGHIYIGSEHILCGLLSENEGNADDSDNQNTKNFSMAKKALAKHKIEKDALVAKIEEVVGRGIPTKLTSGDFTPRSKRILEAALFEAKSSPIAGALASSNSHVLIGTEHLLRALIKDHDCYAAQIIREFGVNLTELLNDCPVINAEHYSDKHGGYRRGSNHNSFGDDDLLSDIGYGSGSSKSTSRSLNSGSGSGTGTVTKKQKNSALYKYCRDLTEMARQNKIDPVVSRDDEIERVIQSLMRRRKNNPCLVGESGVGKTAVAEGLALKIALGNAPKLLKHKRILMLDLSSMLAGAKYRGDFEERIKSALDETIKDGNVILFIDELHSIIGAGAAEGAIDAANILKPMLARGEIQLIGATTNEEYRRFIEKDSALERRFQPITIEEPDEATAICILEGLRDKYEVHHDVKICDCAIKAAVELSSRYISDRFLPDKAIDLIDEAASLMRLRMFTTPPELRQVEEKLKRVTGEKIAAINTQNFETAASLRDKERELKAELQSFKSNENPEVLSRELTADSIAELVAKQTGIPVNRITFDEATKVGVLEDNLRKQVIGQDKAITVLSQAIKRSRVGFSNPERPIGTFIFLGPTGVGKTELSKVLAKELFGSSSALIRLDMSEFMEKHSISKLIGSPPGYVGYDDGGKLTEKIRRKPYSVILFDEIEKAHPDVYNIFLQIMEDGVLTSSDGRKVSFKNCVLIMTSNVGASMITDERTQIGFSADVLTADAESNAVNKRVMNELKKAFKPEFVNRLDDIIVFEKLSHNSISNICRLLLSEVVERAKSLEISLSFSDEVIDNLSQKGYDKEYGARPLRRLITAKIENPLSEKLLSNEIVSGDDVVIKLRTNVENGEFEICSKRLSQLKKC
ncbi:MAG: ATP-dependent Clp protease ATP-binding subunit [Oscillospiraceae bacterium]|nr:ATP-dependent Clp protease ATP-binding subunit [Oscillospiraceae bacterium]